MIPLHVDSRPERLDRRSTYWLNVVQSVCHVSPSLGDRALHTALERHDFGDLSVVAITGSSQRVLVRDWASANTLIVLLPQTPGGFIEIEGARQALQSGRAYVINARGPVLLQLPDRFEHVVVRLASASSELARSFIEKREEGSILLDGGVGATLVSTLLTLFANAPHLAVAAAPLVSRSVGELLHAALVETLGVRDDSAQALDAYHRHRIRQHALAGLGDPDLSVESIAVAVGLSTRRIHQLFADSEMTLMRWIWSERLTRCHSRLVDAVKPRARIGEVAYEWGFSDPAHFSRVFRQRYGATPREHMRLQGRLHAVGSAPSQPAQHDLDVPDAASAAPRTCAPK